MDKLVLITVSSQRIFIIKKYTTLDTENIF